jgi:hypothetical protein
VGEDSAVLEVLEVLEVHQERQERRFERSRLGGNEMASLVAGEDRPARLLVHGVR